MPDIYSKIALQKKFQGKKLSSEVRKSIDKLVGKRLSNIDARKTLIDKLAYKSKGSRERILQHDMGLGYKERGRFEKENFATKMLSAAELRKLKAKQEHMKHRNIYESRKTAEEMGLVGKSRGSYLGVASASSHVSQSSGVVESNLSGKNKSQSLAAMNNKAKPIFTDNNAATSVGHSSTVNHFNRL